METDIDALTRHYESPDLEKRILEAVTSAADSGEAISRNMLAAFDEFHIGGRRATRELGRLCGLKPGWRVLDAGCGVGGPARTLAADFSCRVAAFDLSGEYCRSARRLTELAGLSGAVAFCRADALALPFADACFDAVFSQHVTMNIARKGRLLRGYRRMLRPGGRLALYEVCAGPGGAPRYPLPWAEDEAISFLVAPEVLRQEAVGVGLEEVSWEDISVTALSWLRESVARHREMKKIAPRLSPRLLMGERAAEKGANVSRNLQDHRIRVIRAVFRRPSIKA